MASQLTKPFGESTDKSCARFITAIAPPRQRIDDQVDNNFEERNEILHWHRHTAWSTHIHIIGLIVIERRAAPCLVQPILCYDATAFGNTAIWSVGSAGAFGYVFLFFESLEL